LLETSNDQDNHSYNQMKSMIYTEQTKKQNKTALFYVEYNSGLGRLMAF